MVTKHKGFTLVELMVVVAIIAILVTLIYPSYQEYIKRTKRTAAQAEMMDIAHNLSQYKVINRSYTGATVSVNGIYGANVIPRSGAVTYNLELKVTPSTWVLTATPANEQTGDGHVVLNNQGHRCWTKGSDKNSGSACTPSAMTNWDGR